MTFTNGLFEMYDCFMIGIPGTYISAYPAPSDVEHRAGQNMSVVVVQVQALAINYKVIMHFVSYQS